MNVYVITDWDENTLCVVDDETLCSSHFRNEFGEKVEDKIIGYYLESGKVVDTIKDVPRAEVDALQGKEAQYYINLFKLNPL